MESLLAISIQKIAQIRQGLEFGWPLVISPLGCGTLVMRSRLDQNFVGKHYWHHGGLRMYGEPLLGNVENLSIIFSSPPRNWSRRVTKEHFRSLQTGHLSLFQRYIALTSECSETALLIWT